ncbi:hypothetical protein BaRGS_00016028, partial [Batillaria attramentaria]
SSQFCFRTQGLLTSGRSKDEGVAMDGEASIIKGLRLVRNLIGCENSQAMCVPTRKRLMVRLTLVGVEADTSKCMEFNSGCRKHIDTITAH